MDEVIFATRIGETLIETIDEELDMPDCPTCSKELSIQTPEMQELEDDEYFCKNCGEVKQVKIDDL